MADDTSANPKPHPIKSSKQELYAAYKETLEELERARAGRIDAQRTTEEKRQATAARSAAETTALDIPAHLAALRSALGAFLQELGDKYEAELRRYRDLSDAVQAKVREVEELYGIERNAAALAALLEAQRRQKQSFEEEQASTRADWERERKTRDQENRERDAADRKAREREREEWLYAWNRDKQVHTQRLQDELAALERELAARREKAEKDFREREAALAAAESELADLRARATRHPQELQAAVTQATTDLRERLETAAAHASALSAKEHEGERNVLLARIEALEKAVNDQTAQLARGAALIEAAYAKVQDIAVKAVEGTASHKALGDLQKWLADSTRTAPDPKRG